MNGLPHNANVEEWGKLIRASLELDEACIINFEPGNATRYQLVFTPLNVAQGDELTGCDKRTFVLVSYINHGAYPFRLLDPNGWPLDVGYVMEKFRCNEVTAEPLVGLFNAVLGKTHASVSKVENS